MSHQHPLPASQNLQRNPLTEVTLRVCPECAGPLARNSGCITCVHCGWGRCG